MDNTATETREKVADACSNPFDGLSDAMGRMAQSAADSAKALCEIFSQAAAEFFETWDYTFTRLSLESRAMLWASNKHPEWLTIYNRTKKRRIRKKYRDRIMRAYEEALAHE